MLVTNNLWAHGDNNNVTTRRRTNLARTISPITTISLSPITPYSRDCLHAYPCIVGSTSPNGDCTRRSSARWLLIRSNRYKFLDSRMSSSKTTSRGSEPTADQCGSGGGLTVVGNCWNSLTESNNIIVSNADGQCVLRSTCDWTANQFPFTNSTGATGGQPLWQGVNGTFPSAMFIKWADVGMTNPNNSQFTLLSTSPGFHGASDGTDVGAELRCHQRCAWAG
jgi:hypothetical protein